MISVSYPIQQRGFTLLEIAIVLAIVGFLLKQLVVPFGAGFEQNRRNVTERQLDSVLEAVVGFASAHHRLPCPADITSHGVSLDSCAGDAAHGFVPVVTLGLRGPMNNLGQLLDSWGSPILYSISSSDHVQRGTPGDPDFSTAGEMQAVSFRYLKSELQVCRQASGSSCPRTQLVANQLPIVVLSVGRDKTERFDQYENQNNDATFIAKPYSGGNGEVFDDIVVWMSENSLFYHLIQAGVLP